MTRDQILNTEATKAEKIEMLYRIGIPYDEIIRLLLTNYQYVHSVIKKLPMDDSHNIAGFKILDVPFKHKFGIELEFFGIPKTQISATLSDKGIDNKIEYYNHSTRPIWKITTDASIEGRRACELVSPVLKGKAGIKTVVKVVNAINSKNPRVNKSCGFHVHFNVDWGHDLKTWARVYNNYFYLESIIDDCLPESRRDDENGHIASLHQFGVFKYKPGDNVSVLSRHMENSRYVKINIQSFWRQNTLEFRHHSGTTDPEKIINWIYLCSGIIQKSCDGLELTKHSKSIRTLEQVCPHPSVYEYFKHRKNYFKTAINAA